MGRHGRGPKSLVEFQKRQCPISLLLDKYSDVNFRRYQFCMSLYYGIICYVAKVLCLVKKYIASSKYSMLCVEFEKRESGSVACPF